MNSYLFITLRIITFNCRKKIRIKAISVFECLLSSDIKDVIYKAIKKYCEDIIISLSWIGIWNVKMFKNWNYSSKKNIPVKIKKVRKEFLKKILIKC